MWRRGAGAVLTEGGYEAIEGESIEEWAPGRGVVAVVCHVAVADDLGHLAALTDEYAHIPVVAIAPTLGVAEFAGAVKAGALSALAEDDPIEVLIATVDHALNGRSSVPPTILHAMAMRVAPGFGERLAVDEAGLGRLRALAAGTTVAQLAEDSGFSEREMFRILNDLYASIGVRNRTEAIVWAARYGVLDDSTV